MDKFGFFILIIIFGIFCFLAGLLAPATLRDTVGEAAEKLYQSLSGVKATEATEATEATADASGGATDKATGKIPLPDKPTPLPKGILFDTFKYDENSKNPVGIQVGLYATTADVDKDTKLLTEIKIDSHVYTVEVSPNLNWLLLAAGPYKSVRESNVAKESLRNLFGLKKEFTLISWQESQKNPK